MVEEYRVAVRSSVHAEIECDVFMRNVDARSFASAEYAARDALLSRIRELEADAARLDDMREALRWAMDALAYECGPGDANGTPKHECAFVTNPEAGACAWHDGYWEAFLVAFPEHFHAARSPESKTEGAKP